ncbi:MAG: TonB-dependent receptor [Sphingobacteriales bacterium]|nr:TonB-dependent receptor [Sphingobacteriales bacterium]
MVKLFYSFNPKQNKGMELNFPIPFGWPNYVSKLTASPGKLTKTLLIMKLTAILLLSACLQVSAIGFSQQITLKVKKKSLEQVCLEIGKQSGYQFFFNERLLKDAKKISVELENSTIEQALYACFKDQPFNYAIIKKTIVITKKENVSTDVIMEYPQPPTEISGKIMDENGNVLAGATIKVKGRNETAIADENGRFVIAADKGDRLVFSFVGFEMQEVLIGERNNINIVMKIARQNLDETVIIGYGKTSVRKNTAAVSTLRGESLSNLPLPTLGDGLAGRVPGLIVTSSGGGPGKVPTISIRGGETPVYVIDDIILSEFDFRTLNINDIENISFLKDAGAAGIYGLVAGGGVVLVTTKRGSAGKMSARYDFSYDLSQPTILSKKITSYEVALAINQRAANAGELLPFSEEVLQKYRDQTDPLNYPNTDWQGLTLKKFAPQKRHNLSISAGNKQLQFYGSIGYFDQGTLFTFNTNWLKRYNYRMNITGSFEKIGLKTTLGIYGVSEELRIPSSQYGSGYYFIWGHIQNRSPMESAFADEAQTRYAAGADNPLVEMDPRSGYNRTENRNLNGLLNITWSVPKIEGLEVRVNGNFRQDQSWNKSWSATAPQYSVGSDVPLAQNTPNLSAGAGSGYSYTLQALLGYDRTFLKKHTISVLGGYEENYGYSENLSASRTSYLFNIDQLFAGPNAGIQNNGSASENARAAYLGRLKYDYLSKYFLEGSFRYDGNGNLFPKDKRWGFFPSASLAWIISKEEFFDLFNQENILNYLKLRTSYGTVGQNSNAGNFDYIPGYSINTQAYVIDGQLVPGFGNPGFASPDITWFSQESFNIGADFASLNSRLSGTFDYFYNRTINYLASPSGVSYTDPLGTNLPTVNSNGAFRRAGYEFSLRYNNRIGNLEYNAGVNFVKFDQLWEVNPNEDSATLKNPSTRTTHQTGYYGAGLHTYGYYQSAQDILLNPTLSNASGLLRPGDLWYEDTNGDGKIDEADYRRIGSNTFPRINYGFTLDLKYRSWMLNMLWQGSGSRSVYLGDRIQISQIYPFQLDYWTPANQGAQFPRPVSVASNGSNNVATSDFWIVDGRYLRLKALQIGYDFKKSLLKNARFISDLRLILSGTNLLTFSPLNKYYMDAETGSTNNYDYPTQRVYSASINVGF